MSSTHRRLLYVSHYPVFGGPQNQALRLAAPLREHGWETLVLLPDEPGNAAERLQEAGVPTISIPLGRLRATRSPGPHVRLARTFMPNVKQIREVIRQREIDLVVIGGLHNPHAAVAARRLGIPLVWQLVDISSPPALRRAAMIWVTRLADVVMTAGRVVGRLHPGVEAMGARLVPYFPPVDVTEFAPSPALRAAARSELGLDDDALVVGSVGNLSREKDTGTFVRAAAELRSRHPDTRFVLLGAAYAHRAEETRSLFAEAEALGLKVGRDLLVVDPGRRVAELEQAFDVFWLTSRAEGTPTTVEEAMALGIPVVGTRVGGVPELVAEGETGFLVPSSDPPALAAATEPLLLDESLRLRLGAKARDRATAEFAVEHCVATHVRAFELAVEHRRERTRGV